MFIVQVSLQCNPSDSDIIHKIQAKKSHINKLPYAFQFWQRKTVKAESTNFPVIALFHYGHSHSSLCLPLNYLWIAQDSHKVLHQYLFFEGNLSFSSSII